MDIRKVSIGPDYKSNMNYVVGQKVLGGSYTIHLIQEKAGELKIWLEKDDLVVLWKSFSTTMPSCIEYNINF